MACRCQSGLLPVIEACCAGSSPRAVPRATGRRYWEAQGRRFSRSFHGAPTTGFYFEEEQRLIERYFGPLRGKRLLKLDLWNEAQNTEVLFWAAAQGATCFGVDIADSTATRARERGRALGVPIRATIADAARLPFGPDSFDCLYSMGTLEHLPDPTAGFAELARVLKPGGLAIVGVPNRRDPFQFALVSRLLQAGNCYPYGRELWYTNAELRRGIEAHGLRVIGRDAILFLPWALRFLDLLLWLRCPRACVLTDLLLRPFRSAARLRWLAGRFGYLTVCVARK